MRDSVSKTIAGPNTGIIMERWRLQNCRWLFVAIQYDSLSTYVSLFWKPEPILIQAATLIGYGGVLAPLDLSAATSICLMNRFSGTRAFRVNGLF